VGVTLDKAAVKKCEVFGRNVVAGYAAGRKERSKALFVPGKPTIHDNWQAQADARLAELAFIRTAGFSDDYLNWSDKCDGSHDLKLHNLRIDVKSSTHPRAERLIWPVSKNHFIQDAADILVAVKLKRKDDNSAIAELVGWVGRHTFMQKAEVSKGEARIVKGTKFMMYDNLSNMLDLFHITRIAAAAAGSNL